MINKIFVQCSHCGYHFEVSPMLGIAEGMYSNGYRAVGDAVYCPDCVKTWKDRNGEEFDKQYVNPSKMFANWWNNKVESVVKCKSTIKRYKIVGGVYMEVARDEQRKAD